MMIAKERFISVASFEALDEAMYSEPNFITIATRGHNNKRQQANRVFTLFGTILLTALGAPGT